MINGKYKKSVVQTSKCLHISLNKFPFKNVKLLGIRLFFFFDMDFNESELSDFDKKKRKICANSLNININMDLWVPKIILLKNFIKQNS